MSTTYTPTSNWTNRDLKGRDLQARPLRPSEPVSFGSDPATDRLSRRMAEDVRPTRGETVVTAPDVDDDFMNRPMVNASAADATLDGPDVFDAPMLNRGSGVVSTDESVLDAPLTPTRGTSVEREASLASPAAGSLASPSES